MTTISNFGFANIADLPISVVFLSDGSIKQVATLTGAQTAIAPAGTIEDPTRTLGLAQWGSQYVLMVSPQPNGYFIWDGNVFYKAGSVGPVVSLSNGGAGYTAMPTTLQAISGVSGVPSTAVFQATLSSSGALSAVAVSSGVGAGLTQTSSVVLAFAGGGSTTTAIAYASIAGGQVTNFSIANAGSGYGAQTSVTLAGGGGFGATVTTSVSGSILSLAVKNPGQGYITPPTVVFADVNNPVAQATVATMPFGIQGTAIETFTNHVWVANGAAPSVPPPKSLVDFTAPGSTNDFGTPNGGGAFISTDSFLRVGFFALRQSNGFLYLLGDSSVNYISGVTTTGNPATTTFTNQNIDPQVGTPWPDTVQVFSRAIVFANTGGVYALYGGAVQKVSAQLDGIFSSIVPTGSPPSYDGFRPSAAVAFVFGIHVYILLLPIIDQITGTRRNALLMWDGKNWWTASQSVAITRIASQEISSILTVYGTDGSAIYPLFQTPSTTVTKTVRSKFWDNPTYFVEKHVQNVFGLFQSNTDAPAAFTLSVDTERGVSSINSTSAFAATWLTDSGEVATWLTNSGDVAIWQGSGLSFFNAAIDAAGVLVGLTLQTTSEDFTLISLAVTGQQYKLQI